MKILKSHARRDPSRAGAALLLSMLVLFILLAIVLQLNIGTGTDARIARNDVGLTQMDLAIESQLLEVFEILKADAEADAGAEEGARGGPVPGAEGGPETAAPGAAPGEEPSGPVDSREDEWGHPLPAEINEIELVVQIQDEDGKINILTMLVEDEEEAQKAYDRVVQVLDLCRENTAEDIDTSDAEDMAKAMREHILRRDQAELPRPTLLTDDEEENEDRGMPLTMREFVVLEPFREEHFRDYYDEDGEVVHSIASYLTIYTAPMTQGDYAELVSTSTSEEEPDDEASAAEEEGGEEGAEEEGAPPDPTTSAGTGDSDGFAINVNTAPVAVLKSLMDDRDVPYRFWDDVVEYRNEVDDERDDDEDYEPQLGMYDEEIEPRQFFGSIDEFQEIDGYRDLEPTIQAELDRLVKIESDVFTIFITARRSTAADGGGEDVDGGLSQRSRREQRLNSKALIRTVRCVVWRRSGDSGVTLVPLIRWEVVDYEPFEVQDYPDEDR